MVFQWSLSDSKSPRISMTLLGILAILNNAVIWIVSTRLPTSKSSRPFNNPLVIVPRAPITIGTIVTFTFCSFFNSLARSSYLSFFSHSFSFILWSAGTAKSTIMQILSCLLITIRSGLLADYYYYYYYYSMAFHTDGFHCYQLTARIIYNLRLFFLLFLSPHILWVSHLTIPCLLFLFFLYCILVLFFGMYILISLISLFLIIFTNLSSRAGYDTRSIFQRSLTGLNSVFLLLD